MAALGTADAFSASGHQHGSPTRSKAVEAEHYKRGSTAEAKRSEHAVGPRILLPSDRSAAENAALPPPMPPDLAAAKQAIELARQHKPSDAAAVAASIGDPVAQKLVEWVLLRDSDSAAGFDRIAAFIQANPDWPSISLLRRRAEARLWQERRDAATVHRFLGEVPTSAAGRLALARALTVEGDRAGAEREVRAVWRLAEMSAELEAAVLDTFRNALTPTDDAARMDRRIGAKDFSAAMRAAKRLGHDYETIVKACDAAEANSSKSAALLDAVPNNTRGDLGYVLCRLHWLLGHDDVAAAAKLVAEASSKDLQRQDTDEWWRERRALARRLIDLGNAKTAYRVASEAAPPANPYYRAEFHFLPGWIALRFLADPVTALKHFAHIDDGSADPIVLARAAYWRGRAAEAVGQVEEMHAQYETAARYATAYYGQLARARLGLGEIALHPPPPNPVEGAPSELLHAADILYSIGEFDLVLAFVKHLAEASSDVAKLGALGQLTARYNDAQAMLVIGRTALARGLAMERYAFPEIGVPPYSPIGPQISQCIVYSIVRTESAFDQRDTSPANAVGLMQVTPEAGRDTAKRFGVPYDWNRLVSDPVYNTQMGAAEVTALLKEYNGSYILTFAGYNAGRGRVRQWVAQHGDPRDSKVDAVDWVERIPLAETRNYVQRVMENLQVYRERFGEISATTEPNLHRAAATVEWRPEPDPKAAWNNYFEE
jgi:soluble lytic murein transglycosylase